MQLTPEMKQQLEAQKAQCIFCKIINKEVDSKIVFEDDLTLAALDIFPVRKGHTVYMPKEHYPIIPYMSAEELKHFFGTLSQLYAAVMKAMVSMAGNVFIASGGVAGQQAAHFLLHILPRETDDGFFNFFFKPKEVLDEESTKILQNNFPLMMENHFKRNPAEWHQGEGNEINLPGTIIYQDEKIACIIPEKGMVKGHIEIYSKGEQDYSKFSSEDSFHLFSVASLASTAVFEGLKAQGSNIILKSGKTDDYPDGKLVVHILPRTQGDGLEKLWQPKQEHPKYDLAEIAGRIKDKTWEINSEEKKEEKKEVVVEPDVVKMGEEDNSAKKKGSGNEIKDAIESLK